MKDNQVVRKGDVLFVLDQERYKLAVASAEAGVESRRAAMEMQKRIADRKAQLTNLAASDKERDNARFNANGAVAAYDQAVAELANARLNLARTVITAPVNGFVTNLTLVVGQFAPVGASVMAVIDGDSYRVSGYFEETKIPYLKPGQSVTVTLMSGGPALAGHVESISRGITDRDNPKGPDLLAAVTPTFEWVRLAQRIPVRIHIDSVPDGVLISSGMTCTVVATLRSGTRTPRASSPSWRDARGAADRPGPPLLAARFGLTAGDCGEAAANGCPQGSRFKLSIKVGVAGRRDPAAASTLQGPRSAGRRNAGEPQAFVRGGQGSHGDPFAEAPLGAERVLDDQRDVEAGTARKDAPAALDRDSPVLTAPFGARLITIAEGRVAAAEIGVALPQRGVGERFRDGDRVGDDQRVPQRLGVAERRHRLAVAQMRMHVHQPDFAAEKRRRFGSAKDRLRPAAIGERLVHQAGAVGKQQMLRR